MNKIMKGCECSKRTQINTEGHVEGMCQTMAKEGLSWRLWCFVDEDSECTDVVDGQSFQACENGSHFKMNFN